MLVINLLKKKITKTSGLIIAMLGIVLISSCTYWHNVKLKHLIPDGYEGMIIIAWDQKNGTPKTMEGDYEVYTIPDKQQRSLTLSTPALFIKRTRLYQCIGPYITAKTSEL